MVHMPKTVYLSVYYGPHMQVLRGIDTAKCDTVTDADKKGWQRFGYLNANLPPLRAEVYESKTACGGAVRAAVGSAELEEMAWLEKRLKVLKGLEESKKASGAVCRV